MHTDLEVDARLLARLAKKLADKAGVSTRNGNRLLAQALDVSWGRLKQWRCYRGVPVVCRFRVAHLARKHHIKVARTWVYGSIETLGEVHGGKSNGRKAPRKARAKRHRTQQRERRAVAERRHTGRGAAAAP